MQTDRRTDGRRDGRTDGRTDRQTDRRTDRRTGEWTTTLHRGTFLREVLQSMAVAGQTTAVTVNITESKRNSTERRAGAYP